MVGVFVPSRHLDLSLLIPSVPNSSVSSPLLHFPPSSPPFPSPPLPPLSPLASPPLSPLPSLRSPPSPPLPSPPLPPSPLPSPPLLLSHHLPLAPPAFSPSHLTILNESSPFPPLHSPLNLLPIGVGSDGNEHGVRWPISITSHRPKPLQFPPLPSTPLPSPPRFSPIPPRLPIGGAGSDGHGCGVSCLRWLLGDSETPFLFALSPISPCLLPGFLSEELDQMAMDVVYPAFSPTVAVFLLGATAYGAFKVIGIGGKKQ
ncbi:unnamed protein product [Closterium sp. NIES-54]